MDYSGKGQYCNQGMADAMMDGVMNYVYGEGSDTIEKIAWYRESLVSFWVWFLFLCGRRWLIDGGIDLQNTLNRLISILRPTC